MTMSSEPSQFSDQPIEIPALKCDADGLVPAIIQHHETGAVLMLGYMDAEAVRLTLEKRLVTFWSRSRQEYWTKGETSGNVLSLCEIRKDCDVDALLVRAAPAGPTCHTGHQSCFYRDLSES